jgi:hypothetical protein
LNQQSLSPLPSPIQTVCCALPCLAMSRPGCP